MATIVNINSRYGGKNFPILMGLITLMHFAAFLTINMKNGASTILPASEEMIINIQSFIPERPNLVKAEKALVPKKKVKPIVKKKKISKETPKKTFDTNKKVSRVKSARNLSFKSLIKKYFEPVYPRIALRRGLEGSVKLRISMGANGVVSNVILVKSSGYSFLDESAINAARKWVFSKSDASTPKRIIEKSVVFSIKK